MTQLTWQAVYDLVLAHGARLGADLCAVACADVESGRDPDVPPGDNGASWGLWQLNQNGGLGQGYTGAQLRDPDLAASIMVPVFNQTYQAGIDAGYQGMELVRYCCMYAERPWGFPNLHSPAANRYAAAFDAAVAALGSDPPPASRTYDPDTPDEYQRQDWSCSIRAATWCLRSIGIPAEAGDMQDRMLAAGLVDPQSGLLDGSGSALAAWLAATFGVPATAVYPASWDDVVAVAGRAPVALGGMAWNHWVAARWYRDDADALDIMNPAPGWMGVSTVLTHAQWDRLGPFAVIYLAVRAAPEEDDLSAEERATLDWWQGVAPVLPGFLNTVEDQATALAQRTRGANHEAAAAILAQLASFRQVSGYQREG